MCLRIFLGLRGGGRKKGIKDYVNIGLVKTQRTVIRTQGIRTSLPLYSAESTSPQPKSFRNQNPDKLPLFQHTPPPRWDWDSIDFMMGLRDS